MSASDASGPVSDDSVRGPPANPKPHHGRATPSKFEQSSRCATPGSALHIPIRTRTSIYTCCPIHQGSAVTAMSSARGRGARGRGSGQPPQRGLRGTSTGRGGTFGGNAQGGVAAGRGGFGQPSRGNATKPARGGPVAAKANGFNTSQPQAGAFGMTQARTKWSERYDAVSCPYPSWY